MTPLLHRASLFAKFFWRRLLAKTEVDLIVAGTDDEQNPIPLRPTVLAFEPLIVVSERVFAVLFVSAVRQLRHACQQPGGPRVFRRNPRALHPISVVIRLFDIADDCAIPAECMAFKWHGCYVTFCCNRYYTGVRI